MSCTPKGTLKVECKCGQTIEENCEQVDMQLVGTDERAMGTEYHHDATLELQCDKCKQKIIVEVYCCEYPVGENNYHECKVVEGNAEVIDSCDCEVSLD